ncbi:hypothetical protein KCP69_18165 [Salmonella enterica subsp. enterica]|nr:hypothetical protein KCP69_18165 [Salmonella enterica subsp. enterica]
MPVIRQLVSELRTRLTRSIALSPHSRLLMQMATEAARQVIGKRHRRWTTRR